MEREDFFFVAMFCRLVVLPTTEASMATDAITPATNNERGIVDEEV